MIKLDRNPYDLILIYFYSFRDSSICTMSSIDKDLLSQKTSSTNSSSAHKPPPKSSPYSYSRQIPNELDPEELAIWKLAYSAGVVLPQEALKSIYDLCKYGCDPTDIVKVVDEFCLSYFEKKGSGRKDTSGGTHITRR